MNHLLHQISWHQYLIVAFVAVIIYYLVVTLRYYGPELQNLQRRMSGDNAGGQLQALQYQPTEEEAKAAPVQDLNQQPYHEDAVTDSDILAGKLKACIVKATDKPFAPAILMPQLKLILKENLHITAFERPALSRLIVNECEKTGTALLTEEEVDQWWES